MSAPQSDPSRVLPLQGGRNFRDLGGYATRDGRRTRWGLLFRSGSLARLTPADWDSLRALGVRVVCDLRTPPEREREPFAWADAPGLSYLAREYVSSFAELRRLMAMPQTSADAARAVMIAGYRELPFEQAPAYRQLFAHLAAGEVPLIFNCSAGKDRAGTAAALVLSALGVPPETVLADFTLTDTVGGLRDSMVKPERGESLLARQAPEVVDTILSAHPDYIRAALDSVQSRHGSIDDYLREVLDVDAAALQRIRRVLLE